MVGTHLASSAVRADECESGLTAGVQLFLIPDSFAVLMFSSMLTSDGRCKTLDQSADGYVRGEACGMFILGASTHTKAHRLVLVLVCGSGTNQDGRSS